jgi:hypothetical protein
MVGFNDDYYACSDMDTLTVVNEDVMDISSSTMLEI